METLTQTSANTITAMASSPRYWKPIIVKVVVADSIPPKRLVIRDCDVKCIVGDMLNDYVGIGAERHKREIVPLIERALAGKVPIRLKPLFWPRPPVQQAVVEVSLRYGGFKRRNVVRAIGDTVRRLEAVEKIRQKGRFYCEGDYRYIRGIYTLWLKLYRIVLNHPDRLERGEDAVTIYTP
ncbi:MAG: hypothetical protein QXW60_07990 [Nitrososphaerota archaeon]